MQFRKALCALALVPLVTVVACGGGGAEAPTPAADEAPAANTPDLSNAGTVAGTVAYAGETPEPSPIQMAADPFCQQAHSEIVMRAPVLVDANGGLSNVVVHVAAGLEGYTFPVPSESLLMDQVGCVYEPHVLAARAGQTIVFQNSDDTLHNVNVQPRNNPAFNEGQPLKGMTSEKQFMNPEVGIPARCDVHPWMSAFISVFDHPYFAVSSVDGTFDLDRLPPGDYVVEAWHETLGTQTQSVSVASGEATSLTISFE
jgi:plastocyanin